MAGGSLDIAGANGADRGANGSGDVGVNGGMETGVDGLARVVARRTPAIDLDPDALVEARRLVEETTVSKRAIAARLGVPHASFARFVAAAGWSRPDGAPRAMGGKRAGGRRLAATIEDAGAVMARLLRAVDRQTGRIDSRLSRKGAQIEEKDARILGHLARTLATLMALDKDDGATAKQPEPVDRGELNARLARRIARWAAGGEEPA